MSDKTLRANPVTVRVKALPAGVQPIQVGRYKVRYGYIPDRLELGDVVELKVTVKGEGNIKAFPLPELRLPPGLRGFTPKREVVMNDDNSVLGGTLTWVLPIQATVPGKHRLPAMVVRWFNPDKADLRETRVGPFEFDVTGTLVQTPDEPSQSASGDDSRVVRGPIGSFRAGRTPWSWFAHRGWVLILMGLVVFLWLPRREAHEQTVEEHRRGDLELALEQALGVPVRGLGRAELIAQAQDALGQERAEELDGQLSALDAATYGPSDETAEVMKARLVSWLGEAS